MKPQSLRSHLVWLCLVGCFGAYVAQAQTMLPAKAPAPRCLTPGRVASATLIGLFVIATRSPKIPFSFPACPAATTQERPKPTPTPEQKPATVVEAMPTEGRLAEFPAAEVMRLARMLYIRSRSSWFNTEKLERELLKRKEFGELGLEITRNGKRADLILEITRKPLTTRFTCSFFEPSSERVVAGTTASSLGGEIEPNLADAIVKQFKAARSKAKPEEKKPE
jgi:hypothetical protein